MKNFISNKEIEYLSIHELGATPGKEAFLDSLSNILLQVRNEQSNNKVINERGDNDGK